MELISINGHLVTDIIGKLLSAFFSDGNNTTFKYIEMGRFFSAYYANLFEAPDSFSLMCRQGTDLISMKVPSISRTVIDAYEKQQALQNPHKAPYSLEFHADKVALMTVSSFWMNREDIGFRKFLRKSFAEISDKEIQHLIIDLRDNEGGQDVRGARLLSYLMDRKFRYYDRLEATTDKKYSFARQARLPRFYGIQRILVSKTDSGTYLWKHSRNLKVQRAQRNAYSGKVYVLINGASFSVTSEFASVAHYLKRAVFVGEETGGGYYGNNSGTFVIVMLPNSRLNVGIPMLAYYTAVKNYPWPDRGIMPDYEVKPTLQDILLGKDAVLEFTEQMIATDSK
jgi:C-terminal processing protease CtpA/Prc